MQYSDMLKNKMIQKMTGPDAISASALSKEVDVSQATLSKWLRMAGVGPSYVFPNNAHEYTKMAKKPIPSTPTIGVLKINSRSLWMRPCFPMSKIY